jgi:hypothetical protein
MPIQPGSVVPGLSHVAAARLNPYYDEHRCAVRIRLSLGLAFANRLTSFDP